MKNNVKTLSLCLGLASLALGQTTTAPIYQSSILAGIPTPNSLGDNGPSVFGIVASPQGIAVDKNGNIFISDTTNSRIRRIDATTGVISTYTNTGISSPVGLAFDSKGNLWVAQTGNNGQILRLTQDSKGAVTTQVIAQPQNAAGTFGSDGQLAYSAWFNGVAGLAIDANDDVFIADTSNNRVRLIRNTNNCMNTPITTGNNPTPTSCIIVTIAGGSALTPQVGTSCGANNTCAATGNNTVGDGGQALNARVNGPYGIAVTPDGNTVYVAQNSDHRIRVINMTTGIINTLIGNCVSSTSSSNNVSGGNPAVVPCASGAFGSASNNGTNASVSTLGDGKLAAQATTNSPRGLFLDNAARILYFADQSNNRIRAIDLSTNIVTTVIGSGSGTSSGDQGSGLNSGLLTSVGINSPYSVWVQNGLIYFTEQGANKVRVADPAGNLVKTLVNTPRSSGSGGPGINAYLGFTTSFSSTTSPRVAVDGAGNVYITENATNKIRKVTADGTITDWAGTGASGSTGDGGPAVVARLNNPQSVAFDSLGNGYIADTGNGKIRKVDTSGNISTIVGRARITTCSTTASASGSCTVDKSDYVGDGGPLSGAVFSAPQGIAVDSKDNLIVADTGHNSIRYIDLANNKVSTLGGGTPAGTPGGPTDGRSALATSGLHDSTNALLGQMNFPRGVAVDKAGNIYIADYNNAAARELVNNGNGGYSLFTFYGSGSSSGNAPAIPTTGTATVPARLRLSSGNLTSVAVDPGGNVYFALGADSRVILISADHSKMYQPAGGGTSDTGLTYTAANAFNLQVPAVTGVAVDNNGVLYTADRTGLVKKLVCTKNCLPLK